MKISFIIFFGFLLSACERDQYSGFGCTAQEDHPAVAHARELSQEKLKFLFYELDRLKKIHSNDDIKYSSIEGVSVLIKPIPKNLEFLNARVISPNTQRILLADCFDEHVNLYKTKLGIRVSWAAPTSENPYLEKNETLWSKNQ